MRATWKGWPKYHDIVVSRIAEEAELMGELSLVAEIQLGAPRKMLEKRCCLYFPPQGCKSLSAAAVRLIGNFFFIFHAGGESRGAAAFNVNCASDLERRIYGLSFRTRVISSLLHRSTLCQDFHLSFAFTSSHQLLISPWTMYISVPERI